MNLPSWLSLNTKNLEQANISTARLDCLILLEDATNKDRAWLLAHPEYELDKVTHETLNKQIFRRTQHEPLAYIRGKSEFYGREFAVNAHTLQPRPETETMIELLQELIKSRKLKVESRETPSQKPTTKNQQPKTQQRLHGSDVVQGEAEQQTESYQAYDKGVAEASTQQRAERTVNASSLADWQDSSAMTIVDVGTGSGCIAITAKLLYPEAHVIAIDIDDKCLNLARQNAKIHHTDIKFLKGNLLDPLSNINYQASNIILLANLPYVPDAHIINEAATHEPRHAIFGGPDGLDYYRELFEQTANLAQLPTYVLTEALPPQHKKLSSIANSHGYTQTNQSDFIQLFSVNNR